MPSYTAVYADGTKEHVKTEAMLGQGGEGRVYTIVRKSDVVAKIYHPKYQTRDRYEKLRVMISSPPEDKMRAVYGHVSIAWPMGLLIAGGKFVGYLMPRIQQRPKIINVFSPKMRRQHYPHFTWRHLHYVGANLAAAMHALHVRGYVVGDVNPNNILVTKQALVTLVDTDSFQVRDPVTGKVYRCEVGLDSYTPPELQGVPFRTVDRTEEHDRFGLAVLIFQLLMEGTHPFMGVPRNPQFSVGMPSQVYCIKQGIFPYVQNPQFAPPKTGLQFTDLVPEVRNLFLRAFVEGHRDPYRRPSALEWYTVLTQAEGELVQCAKGHWHARHLSRCPWCEREKQLQRIPRQRQRPRPQPSPVWFPPQQPLPAQSAVVLPPSVWQKNAFLRFLYMQFGFSGQVGRRTWWLRGTLPMAAASGALELFAYYVPEPSGALLGVAILLGLLFYATVWSWIALTVKRLHDRGRSGWWIVAWMFASVIPCLGILASIWLWVECGFLPQK